jgi:hypothetical protein
MLFKRSPFDLVQDLHLYWLPSDYASELKSLSGAYMNPKYLIDHTLSHRYGDKIPRRHKF